jgi:hypothetical protein
VLLKCLLDQIFFATQQDFMFLCLCAYSDTEVLSDALVEVRDTLLTTWIVDCSLWPVVNFVGFAFVPYTLQPTYMAFISYFWQLYLSASAAGDDDELSEKELETLFKALDTDNVSDATSVHFGAASELDMTFIFAPVLCSEQFHRCRRAAGILPATQHPRNGRRDTTDDRRRRSHGPGYSLQRYRIPANVSPLHTCPVTGCDLIEHSLTFAVC